MTSPQQPEPRPSRVLVWLLHQSSSTHAANAVLGDIAEELADRRAGGDAPRHERRWLNREVAAAIVAALQAAGPRAGRAAGHVVRDAARSIVRAPAHALVILLILAVAIAAATVTFSVVDAVVLAPLPFDDPDSLVLVSGRGPRGLTSLAPEEFWAIHDHAASFDSMASGVSWTSPVRIGAVSEELTIRNAGADLFRVERLRTLLGRMWSNADESRGAMRYAVVSESLWRRRFGAAPSVLGRTLQVSGTQYEIVGVVPTGGQIPGTNAWDVWVPRVPDRIGTPNGVSRNVFALGRLREGVSIEAARAEVQALLAPLAAAKPYGYADWEPVVVRWRDALASTVRGWMLLALAAVTLVVLIGCVNAANVMLIRSAERTRELAIRGSLGASRRQIAMSLVVESVMLSTAAGLCALGLAVWGVAGVKAVLPPNIFRAAAIAVNARVFVAALTAAVATGVLFGTLPAWQASRVSVLPLLKDGGGTVSGRGRWRSALLIGEIACVSILLVVGTLFVASFLRVTGIDLGVSRSNVLAVSPRREFSVPVDEVVTRLRHIPGVVDVAVTTFSSLPLVGPAFGGAYGDTRISAADAKPGDPPILVRGYRVTSNYFAVAGTPFRRGSSWGPETGQNASAIVIDELTARRLFGDRDALGQRVRGAGAPSDLMVVGVVPAVYADGPEHEPLPSVYLPIVPSATRRYAGLFVRTSVPPATLAGVVEDALAPLTAAPGVHTIDDAVGRMTAVRRFNTIVMSTFALVAMLIGAAGIYAVMAAVVAQQTREIGVRMALGATVTQIRRQVLGHAARHLVVGVSVGIPVAWWVSRSLGALLFRVRPGDASTYVIVTLLLGTVGLMAAALPARRASRVDPVLSLRHR